MRLLFIAFLCVLSIGIKAQTQMGKASVYHNKYHGRKTFSGEVYKKDKVSAAHAYLPMGTKLHVTNLETNKTLEVTINDRMSKKSPYVIDLSHEAARLLGIKNFNPARILMMIMK